MGSTSRVYRLVPGSGFLRPVGAGPFVPALTGTSFGVDFNPTVDRIRVTSDTEQNLRLNPDTGAVAGTDAPLAYRAGDAGAGTNPSVGAVAYTNSFAGATTTQLFGIDSARDALVLQDPPNAGVLNTVGALGVDVAEPVGFDIGTANAAYAAVRRGTESASLLHRIDLTSGRATPVSDFPRTGGGRLVAIAAGGSAPDDTRAPRVSVASSSTQLRGRLLSRGVAFTVACDEACSFTGTVRAGGRTAGPAPGAVIDRAGRERTAIRLTSALRAQVRRPGRARLVLTVRVRDTAGNTTTVTRGIRERVG